ncbi:MAG: hypothetical protein QOF30_3275 [Acidimicrobiaceae bacterium]|nr:hypothetical protein [Acidimicrobiaceae bacterium]
MRVDNVGHSSPSQKGSDLMGMRWCERLDIASAEETPELNLTMRPAYLGHYRRRGDRNETQLEPDAMIGPDLAVVALGADKHTCVVDDSHAERG